MWEIKKATKKIKRHTLKNLLQSWSIQVQVRDELYHTQLLSAVPAPSCPAHSTRGICWAKRESIERSDSVKGGKKRTLKKKQVECGWFKIPPIYIHTCITIKNSVLPPLPYKVLYIAVAMETGQKWISKLWYKENGVLTRTIM